MFIRSIDLEQQSDRLFKCADRFTILLNVEIIYLCDRLFDILGDFNADFCLFACQINGWKLHRNAIVFQGDAWITGSFFDKVSLCFCHIQLDVFLFCVREIGNHLICVFPVCFERLFRKRPSAVCLTVGKEHFCDSVLDVR